MHAVARRMKEDAEKSHRKLHKEAEAFGFEIRTEYMTLPSVYGEKIRFRIISHLYEGPDTKKIWFTPGPAHHGISAQLFELYFPGIQYSFYNSQGDSTKLWMETPKVFIPRGKARQKLHENAFVFPNLGCFGDAVCEYPKHALATILNSFWHTEFNLDAGLEDESGFLGYLFQKVDEEAIINDTQLEFEQRAVEVFKYWERLSPAEVIRLLSETDSEIP